MRRHHDLRAAVERHRAKLPPHNATENKEKIMGSITEERAREIARAEFLKMTDPWAATPRETARQTVSHLPEVAAAEVIRYLRKPMRKFHQLDGWAKHGHGDDIMVPDDDGDVLMCGGGTDRQNSGTTVRIMVDPAADREDVLRVLHKLTAWYESEDSGAMFSPQVCPF